jgi:hypothetical protein
MHTPAKSAPCLQLASVAEVKPRPWRLALAIACAASVCLAGDVIIWHALRPDGHRLWCLVGLALLLAGVLLLLAVRRLARLRLWMLPGGFAVVSRGDGKQLFLVGQITKLPFPSNGHPPA